MIEYHLRLIAHTADDGDRRDSLLPAAIADSAGNLSKGRLPVDSSLTGYDQIHTFQKFIKMNQIQHRLDSRLHLRLKEYTECRSQTAGSAGTRNLVHIGTHFLPDQGRVVNHSLLQFI